MDLAKVDPRRLEFVVVDTPTVTAHDIEHADVSNPSGAIFGSAYCIVATSPEGYRWAHAHNFVDGWFHTGRYDEDGPCGEHREGGALRAERLLERITKHVARGGALGADHWVSIDPVYGSPAYQREGIELQRWHDERVEAGVF